MGVDLMLGHVLGDAFDEPVMIVRFATQASDLVQTRLARSQSCVPPAVQRRRRRPRRQLGCDPLQPRYSRHPTANPKKYSHHDEDKFPIAIPIDRYEKNLREIVAKLKKTGATLIWARITPVRGTRSAGSLPTSTLQRRGRQGHERERRDHQRPHAESIRQGFPKRADVHSVGNLAPKVTETIEKALADRENKTKPLPRVLMWGDSITGSYWEKCQAKPRRQGLCLQEPDERRGHSGFWSRERR
jgi:hypothetical protein